MIMLILTLGIFGQTETQDKGNVNQSTTRLEFMKKSVATHSLTRAGDPSVTYRLSAEPAMRFTNSVGTVTDGTIFFWLDGEDRPVAAVQVYRITSGSWHHAFSSLSTFPLLAGNVWTPARAGVEFKPVPEAPKPAATAEQRLRQMREMHEAFKAEMNFGLKTWHTLRPLTKPLLRYGKAGSGVIDGGVFAFVLTTDPELYLLLEARRGTAGPEWQYAFAPEASSPIRCTLKGKDAWSFDFSASDNQSTATYYDWEFSQEP